ncbi:MAG TPA: TonB-dependent receptor [Candidatus Tumulicola sp.]|nr:TonB-dependent receptor [Candidatus Tumulicola sp.]
MIAALIAFGVLAGTVTDDAGAPIPAARISIAGLKSPPQSSTTDEHGSFVFERVKEGLYRARASKPGYVDAEQTGIAIAAGGTTRIALIMPVVTLSSLRVLGSTVIYGRRGGFNTTPASIAVITPQTFADQGQLQVARILDQTPGVVSGHALASANGGSPGALTTPDVRGGLSYETASLIDGHPVAVGRFGAHNTTFINAFVLQDVEIVKGPGASAPEVNYAIGGTVNFRTRDPTQARSGALDLGYDSYGGQFSNFLASGTLPGDRLGYVLDYAVNGSPGPMNRAAGFITLPATALINGQPQNGSTTFATVNPGVQNNPQAGNSTLIACCLRVSSTFDDKTELLKLRYKLSSATVATAAYFGSQTWTDQNGKNLAQLQTNFRPDPTAGYIGLVRSGPLATFQSVFFPEGGWEVNNEPILQAEVRSTWRTDTILARAYSASINRLQYNALESNAPASASLALYGTVNAPGELVFNGQQANVTFPGAYVRSTKEDLLRGASLELDHPAGATSLSLALERTQADSFASDVSGAQTLVSIPAGSSQRFTTLLLRGEFPMGDRVRGTLANYFDWYDTRFTKDVGATFQRSLRSRYDGRFGMVWRPAQNVAWRVSLGSAVAPPFLNLLDVSTTSPQAARGNLFATSTLNNGSLLPETAFGFDVGSDVQYGDGRNAFVWDAYTTALQNQFITSTFGNGTACVAPFGSPPNTPCSLTLPLFTSVNGNLGNARYQGLELALRRVPDAGLGYLLQGALLKAYPVRVGPGVYASSAGPFTTNLGVIEGANYQTSGSPGVPGTFNSLTNQGIPYSQAYGELSYRGTTNYYYSIGVTLYGPNNSFNRPAFAVWNATARFALDRTTTFQVSVDNLSGAYGGTAIDQYGGVPVPLANGRLGLTNGNVIGPRVVRFILHRGFGAEGHP